MLKDKIIDLYIFGQYEDYKDVFAIINISFTEKYLLKKMTESIKKLSEEQQEELLQKMDNFKRSDLC